MSPRKPKAALLDVLAWQVAAEDALSILTHCLQSRAASTLHGTAWRDGMVRYYGGRLEAILKIAPKGAESDLADLRARYARLIQTS